MSTCPVKGQFNWTHIQALLVMYSAGAILPDEGSAYICGHSMQRDMARARQLVGYCPQFDALPGTLTGIPSLSHSR